MRVSARRESIVVKNVTAVSRVGTAVTILRFAPQMADVLHRHKVLKLELRGNFATLRDGAQHLRACLTAIVQACNEGAFVRQSHTGGTLQLLHKLLVRQTIRQDGLNSARPSHVEASVWETT